MGYTEAISYLIDVEIYKTLGVILLTTVVTADMMIRELSWRKRFFTQEQINQLRDN